MRSKMYCQVYYCSILYKNKICEKLYPANKHYAVIKRDTMDMGKCSDYIEDKGQLEKQLSLIYKLPILCELHVSGIW